MNACLQFSSRLFSHHSRGKGKEKERRQGKMFSLQDFSWKSKTNMNWNLQIKQIWKTKQCQQVTCAVIVLHFRLCFQYAFLLPLNSELFFWSRQSISQALQVLWNRSVLVLLQHTYMIIDEEYLASIMSFMPVPKPQKELFYNLCLPQRYLLGLCMCNLEYITL